MKKILFINPGWEQQPLLNKLFEHNIYELYACCKPGFSIIDRHVFKSVLDTDYLEIPSLDELEELGIIDAVISDQCDYSLFSQAIIASALSLPGPTPQAAYLSNNKYIQRLKCEQQGIKIPKYRLVHSESEVKKFAEEFKYPIILKPVDNRGSFGVNKVSNSSEVRSAFLIALANSRSKLILAEEYIDGKQYSVDGYARPGCKHQTLAIGEKTMLSRQSQVAMAISYPANLHEEQYMKLSGLNEDVNTKLGYTFGNTHSEYMLKDGEFYLIESSNRGGGCWTSEVIVPRVCEKDIVSQYIKDCLGENNDYIASNFAPKRNKITLQFFTANPGTFKGISNWNEIKESENYVAGRINLDLGDDVPIVKSDASRHGFLILKGDAEDAKDLIGRLRFSQ